MKHIINCLVENQPGVLARIVGLISGRGYNIDTLNVGPTADPTVSNMTIVVPGDAHVMMQVTRQLSKHFYFAAFGLEVVYYVPGLFKSETTAAGLIRFGTSLLIAAFAFWLAIWLTKRYMPMDYRILKRAQKPEKPKDENKPQEKMPKIVMPD